MSVQPAPITPPAAGYPEPTVLLLTGSLDATSIEALQHRLTTAVDAAPGDLYLDVHGVTSCSDVALTALTAARSRSKRRRTRLVVLDDADGVVARALRRTGRHFRVPIFPDADEASTALAAGRAAVGRVVLAPAGGPGEAGDAAVELANPYRQVVA